MSRKNRSMAIKHAKARKESAKDMKGELGRQAYFGLSDESRDYMHYRPYSILPKK